MAVWVFTLADGQVVEEELGDGVGHDDVPGLVVDGRLGEVVWSEVALWDLRAGKGKARPAVSQLKAPGGFSSFDVSSGGAAAELPEPAEPVAPAEPPSSAQ